MPGRARLVLMSLCTAAAAVALPAPAHAASAQVAVVTTANTYFPGDLVVVQGTQLTLVNADTATHDIKAVDFGPTGPLFQSAIIGPGKTAPVLHVEDLPLGIWAYVCSIHDGMAGTIEVKL